MKKLIALFFLVGSPVYAVPVVPNFSAGATTARTTSTQNTTELIESWNYSTGYTYTSGGTNIKANGVMTPQTVTAGTHSVNGVTTTHYGIDLNTKPTYSMHTPGASTNYMETYSGPGLQSFTRISRDITLESVTETTSTFTQ